MNKILFTLTEDNIEYHINLAQGGWFIGNAESIMLATGTFVPGVYVCENNIWSFVHPIFEYGDADQFKKDYAEGNVRRVYVRANWSDNNINLHRFKTIDREAIKAFKDHKRRLQCFVYGLQYETRCGELGEPSLYISGYVSEKRLKLTTRLRPLNRRPHYVPNQKTT